jgi:glucose dehydrogenase
MRALQRRLSAVLLILALPATAAFGQALDASWAHYGGDEGGSRFSPLTQINRDNVAKLELAWQ